MQHKILYMVSNSKNKTYLNSMYPHTWERIPKKVKSENENDLFRVWASHYESNANSNQKCHTLLSQH